MLPRDPQLVVWLGAFFAAFAALILAGQLAARRRIDGIWRMFGVTMLTTMWLLGPAWLGGWWFVAALLVTAVITTLEMCGVVERLGSRPSRSVSTIAAAACLAAATQGLGALAAVIVVLTLAVLIKPVIVGSLERAFADGAATMMTAMYPGFCLAFALLVANGPAALGGIVFLFVALEVNDASAFLVGRLAGRTPYAPVLSPKKTIEGAIGGLIAGAVAGALLAWMLPGVTRMEGALLGLLLAVLGQLADLAASAVKRQAGVKDYAATIPTQGGVLDVYDAVIMVMPAWYLLLRVWP